MTARLGTLTISACLHLRADSLDRDNSKEVGMSNSLGRGFHAPSGKPVDSLAYERWTGRWSRMFVPMAIAAAQVAPGDRILTSPREPERPRLRR